MARSSTTFPPGYHSAKSYTFPPGTNHPNAKLSAATVRRLRHRYQTQNISIQSITDQMGMKYKSIYKMLKDKSYKDVY